MAHTVEKAGVAEGVSIPRPIRDDDFALSAFNKVVAAGYDEKALASYLAVIGMLLNAPKGADKVGKAALRSLRALAEQLRSNADAVEHVNADPLLSPYAAVDRAVHLPATQRTRVCRDFQVLPRILRLFADVLVAQAEAVARFRRGPGRSGVEWRYLIIVLLGDIRRTTGKSFYEATASMLAPLTPEGKEPFSPEALNKLYGRHASGVHIPRLPRILSPTS